MTNAQATISFTKSYTRDIRVKGAMFKIIQKQHTCLSVFDEYQCIYHYDAITNEVAYDENIFYQIKEVLHQAHVDRYPIKQRANTHATDNI
jgi:hypothetical protein